MEFNIPISKEELLDNINIIPYNDITGKIEGIYIYIYVIYNRV